MKQMTVETSYNFRRVNDRITTSGIMPAEQLASLAAEGYEAIINLLPDSSEYALPGERDIVEGQGLQYFPIPVDFLHPTTADFDVFCATLTALGDRKVHIHCAANYRVTAFFALYAVQSKMWSQITADEFIADVWDPDEHPGWPEFMPSVRDSTA